MNEYVVIVRSGGAEREFLVEAGTARAARELAEDRTEDEVLSVRLTRVLSFGCRVRDGDGGG